MNETTVDTKTIKVNIEDMKPGDVIEYRDHQVTILGEVTYGKDFFGRTDVRYMARTEDGQEGWILFGTGIQWYVTR